MKNYIFNIRALFVILTLVFAINAWGEDKTITITATSLGLKGTTYSTDSKSVDGVTIGWTDLLPSSGNIQAKATTGAINNTTAIPGIIKNIIVNHTGTARQTTISFGTSEDCESESTTWSGTNTITPIGDYTYFKITRGANAAYWTSIIVTYEEASADTRTEVNMSTFTTVDGVTSIVKGNTLATSVTNDQSGWTAAYTYSSDKESVATVDANGVITGIAKGTAKIKASLNVSASDANYKAGTTTYKEIEITVTNPTYHYTFSANGTTFSEGDVEEGEAITFPAEKPEDIYGKTFVGWYGSEYSHATDAPTYVTSATMGTSDIKYYAVYAKATVGEVVWEETSLTSLSGNDVFVFSDGSYAMTNNNGTSSAPSAVSITVANNKITSEVTDAMKWNIGGNSTDGYTFYPNGSTTTWLYCNTTASSSSNNNLRVGTGDRKLWISSSNKLKTNDSYTARYISNYSNSDFRGYTSSSSAFVPKFYKKMGGTTYSDYCTTVTAPKVTPIISLCTYETTLSDNTSDQDYLVVTYNGDSNTPSIEHVTTVADIAFISISGGETTITPSGEGLTSVIITADATDYFYAASANFKVIVNEADTSEDDIIWTKVTSVDELVAGDEVIIVSIADSKALCEIASNVPIGDRKGYATNVTISADGNTVTSAKYATVLTLEEYGDYFALHSKNGYLKNNYNAVDTEGNLQKTDLAWCDEKDGQCYWNPTKYEADESKTYIFDVDQTLFFKNIYSDSNNNDTNRGLLYSTLNYNIVGYEDSHYFANYSIDNYGTTQGSNRTQSYTPVGIYKKEQAIKITLNAACHVEKDGKDRVYGTYSNSTKAFVVPADLTVAEVGIQANGTLLVTPYATGATVPANTGVMVSADAGGTYKAAVSKESGSSVMGTDNRLRPSGDDGISASNMAEKDSNCKYYRLTMHNGTQIGYWWGAENGGAFKLAANKAYLAVPNSTAVKSGAWFGDNETDGIVNVDLNVNDGEIYNLNGQRINMPVHGQIYIMNGRKFIAQ